jgi:AcrR family transcriptional regulator
MSDEDFQRARSPEQKEERKTLLLEAARELLTESRTEQELSLNELAKRAGMAKSNVYRYFESREAILLELLRQEWTLWFGELRTSVDEMRLPRPGSKPAARRGVRDFTRVDQLVLRVAETMAQRPLLGRLCSILSSVLEQNVSAETVRAFKLDSVEFVKVLSEYLHGKAPELSTAQYEELFHTGFSALVGLWALAHPAPAVAAVLEDPRLTPFRHDFARDFARHLSLLARGLLALEASRDA